MNYITEPSQLADRIKLFQDYSNPVGVDIETTGLDPYTAELRTIQLSDGKDTIVIDVRHVGKEAVAHNLNYMLANSGKIKIFHNAKFDLKFLKHHLGAEVDGIFDSYLSSLMLEGGLRKPKGFHGLGQVSERYTGEALNKDEQRSDWSGELSDSQLRYAAKDAEILLPVREAMVEKLKEKALIRCAKLEFDCLMPIVWLELSGFYLDFEQWLKIAEGNRVKADEVYDKVCEILAPFIEQQNLFGTFDINLNSVAQVNEFFLKAGVPMPESTKEWLLTPLVDEYPLVKYLLEFRGYDKANTAFGENYREFVNAVTGRIHADFMQIGASTGRFSCSNPNLQQIPQDSTHRNCFRAEEGNTLLSLDYSQIELRILADLAKDDNAIEAFKSGVDYHTAMAIKAFKLDPTKPVSSEHRTFAKRLNFGIPYGIGPQKFSMQVGLSQVEGQQIMSDYFKAVPKIKRWLDYQKYRVLKEFNARSVSGRLALYECEDLDDFKTRGQMQRYACNFPIQASSADITKRAMRIAYDRLKDYRDRIKFVNVVHDEMNFEVPLDLVETVQPIIHKSMVEAGEEFIHLTPVNVDSKTSEVWKK